MGDGVRGVEGSDRGQATGPFHEPGSGLGLGLHRTLGEGPVPKLRGGHVEHGLLARRAEVGVHVRDVSEDEQEIGLESLGQESGSEVLVDDGFDPGQRPGVVIGCDGDTSAAVTSPRSHVAEYAWDAYDQAPSPEAWIADDTGLPDPPVEFTGDTGPQVILAGNYDWRREAEQNKNIPTLWTHLVSLFVKKSDLNALLAELAAKDLAHAISRVGGARYGDGFVGEYPFGQHYGAEAHIYKHEHDEPFGVPTIPTTVDILGEYEYSLINRISLIAPAPILFGSTPGALNWDGKSSWRDMEGRPIATVRNVFGEGQKELAIDQNWLENWLDEQGMAIVWLELLGKDVMRDGSFHNSHPGRLLRSRARHRTAKGLITALEPYYERIPAWQQDKASDASTSGK